VATSKKPTVKSFATSPTIGGYTGPKNVTPVAPNLGLGKITTPVAVNIGGSIITLPAPNLTPVQKTPVAPSLPSVQKTPIASLRPTIDKSEEKKPLEWGFKGRKKTDIDYEPYYSLLEETYRGPSSALDEEEKKSQRKAQEILDKNMKKLERSAKKNKYIDKQIDRYGEEALRLIDQDFVALETYGVPRELTGKMLGNNLGIVYLNRLTQKGTSAGSYTISQQRREDWKKGWLRFHNELNKNQQETFQVLSDNWLGSPNELVDAVKVIGTYKT
jgi:hypothetical protein